MITDQQRDERVDTELRALATPVAPGAGATTAVGAFASALTATRGRVVLLIAWILAVVAAAVCTLRATTSVTTSLGPASAHCGLDVYLYGYPDSAVTHACRHAESARFAVFAAAALIVLAGVVAGLLLAARTWSRARVVDALAHHPVDTAFIALGALAAIGGVFALRPTTVDLVGSGSLTTAHCGLDTYLFGYPDAAIQHACTNAFAPQAHVLLGVVVLALVGVGALLHLLTRTGSISRRHVAAAFGALALAVALVAAIRPVTVTVAEGGASVSASCGVDSYVAGYPDAAVQHACRSHEEAHAAGLVAVVLLVAVGALALAVPVKHAEERTGSRT